MARRGSYAKGIVKREEILAKALEVVARNGYGRATLKELAEAVDLSQAGVLHYFSSKEDLFAEVLRKRDEVDRASFAGGPATETGDLDGGDLGTALDGIDLDGFFDGFVEIMRHNADVPGLVQLYARLSADATDPGHPAHAYFARRSRTFRRFAAEAVRARQDAGDLPASLDADQVATMLIALADGLQVQWLMDPTVDMAAHIERFVGLLGAAPAN